MNVNKKVYSLLIFIFTIHFYNCKNEIQQHEIISKVINEILKEYEDIAPFIPQPSEDSFGNTYKLTTKDSLKYYKNFCEEKLRKKTIALENKMFEIKEKSFFDQKYLIDEGFSVIQDEGDIINLNDIHLCGSYNLIYYEDFHRNRDSKGFEEIDIHFSFSQIKINKKLDKVILIVGVRFSKLNGISTLYSLEKKGTKWFIKSSKGLSIS
jgi:hypothetical protein